MLARRILASKRGHVAMTLTELNPTTLQPTRACWSDLPPSSSTRS
jgi:hypothetical protein